MTCQTTANGVKLADLPAYMQADIAAGKYRLEDVGRQPSKTTRELRTQYRRRGR